MEEQPRRVEEALTGVGEVAGRVAGAELAHLRREHPSAALAELEVAVDGALAGARTRPPEELATERDAAPGACGHCVGPLVRRGKKPRAVSIAQRAEPLRLERAYWRACAGSVMSAAGGAG